MDIHVFPGGLGESLTKDYGVGYDALGLEHCIRRLGIVNPSWPLDSYRDVSPWQARGAESFDAVAEVISNGEVHRFIAKALWSLAQSSRDIVTVWLRRRELLSRHGVLVPQLYAVLNSTLYEEYIDHPLPRLTALSPLILNGIGSIASALDYLGFEPLSFLNDLRVKGDRVYYVDFGSDLGEPSQQNRFAAITCLRRILPTEYLHICTTAYKHAAAARQSGF